MSECVGGCLALVGVVKMFDVFDKGFNYLRRDVRLLNRENDTKCKQIFRVVSNVLHIIGLFCAALAMISMGATLITLAPNFAFLAGLEQAVHIALPYLIGSLASLSAGVIVYQVAR